MTTKAVDKQSLDMDAIRAYGRAIPLTEGAARSDDPLTVYLAQLRHIEPLDSETQQALAERYHESGDPDAARALQLANLRLVVKIAREMRWRRTSLVDLVQQGNMGLAEAIDRFDPDRGVKFSSYASYWVRAMIYGYLMTMTRVVKVGNTRAGRKLFYNLHKVRRELAEQGEKSPTFADIAARLGVSEEEVERVAPILDGHASSLDAPVPGYDAATLGDFLEDDSESPAERVAEREVERQMLAAFDAFRDELRTDRERAIWDKRMVAEDGQTLQELGEQFDVSRERIRQIESRIKRRFQSFFTKAVPADARAAVPGVAC